MALAIPLFFAYQLLRILAKRQKGRYVGGMIKSTVIGNYPKLPSAKGDVNIRRQLHRLDKNEIAPAEIDRSFDEVTARVLREQREAGIDLPTDGQIRWDDIVTPLARELEGFAIGGLLRWFDNNVYYRKPQIIGEVNWRNPITVRDYAFARQQFSGAVKAVLPAPFSFMALSDNHHYRSESSLLAALVKALRAETQSLLAAGATEIQFDDPCLPYQPAKAETAISALNEVIAGLKGNFWIAFYFSDIRAIIEALENFSGGVIAVDCVSHPRNFETMMSYAGNHDRCFGILDARNIKLESSDSLIRQCEVIARRHQNAWVSPSCGLEFLPHRYALAKLKLLGGSVRALQEGQVHA